MDILNFSRIMVIFIEREGEGTALIASRCDLIQAQQQQVEHRDEFLESIVAKIFNDASIKLCFDLSGLVSGNGGISTIDLNAIPPTRRTG